MGAKRKIDITRTSNLKKGIQNSKWQRIQADEKENVPVCVSYPEKTSFQFPNSYPMA